MSEFKEQVKSLVALQEKDCAIDKLREKAAEWPQKIEEQNAKLAALKADAENSKKTLTQLQLERKQKELELDTKENEIRKHTNELNAVKTNDAYKALLIEIESSKQDKSALENEILDCMERIEKETVNARESEKEFKGKEAGIRAEIAKLEAELASLRAAIGQQETERAEFTKTIPQDIVGKYEAIRESRQGIAIAAIEGEKCGECRMVVRPALIVEVCKGKEMVLCDSCSRILYQK